jgi:hypothetical protein
MPDAIPNARLKASDALDDCDASADGTFGVVLAAAGYPK